MHVVSLGDEDDTSVRHSKNPKLNVSVWHTNIVELVFMHVTEQTYMLCYIHKPQIKPKFQFSHRTSEPTLKWQTDAN